MLNANCFIHGTVQPVGNYVVAPALTAARWGVLATDWYVATFFSPATTARYRLVGEIVGHLMVLAIIAGRMARIRVQGWVDAQVAESTPAPAIPDIDLPELEELLAEAERLTSKPAPEIPVAPAQAASIAEPVAVLVIPVPEQDGLESLTIRQLKDRARGRVPGFSKMNSAMLIDRLRALA